MDDEIGQRFLQIKGQGAVFSVFGLEDDRTVRFEIG
jgi:hypothetical protein